MTGTTREVNIDVDAVASFEVEDWGPDGFDCARCVESEHGRKFLHEGRDATIGDIQSVGHLPLVDFVIIFATM